MYIWCILNLGLIGFDLDMFWTFRAKSQLMEKHIPKLCETFDISFWKKKDSLLSQNLSKPWASPQEGKIDFLSYLASTFKESYKCIRETNPLSLESHHTKLGAWRSTSNEAWRLLKGSKSFCYQHIQPSDLCKYVSAILTLVFTFISWSWECLRDQQNYGYEIGFWDGYAWI